MKEASTGRSRETIRRSSRRVFLRAAAGVAAAMSGWRATHAVAGTRAPAGALTASIRLEESAGTIDPNIYGHFAEHIGGVIHDGIWVGRDSKIPNVEGYRLALLEHVRRLGPVVLRWPGGCFADRYHWRDGIGPVEKRPRRFGRWREVTERNIFGTHEFIRFCRLAGFEPYLAANVGTGTPEEFQSWVEYSNAPAGTLSIADERAENGHLEPFGIRFWGVGNESWGCGGTFTPEDYCTEYRKFTTWVAGYGVPLYLIASGPNSNDIDWTRRFFKKWADGARAPMQGWSPHYYCGTTGHALRFTRDEWYLMLEKANAMEKLIRDQWAAVGEFDREHKIRLIIDEWGAWHPEGTEINKAHLFEQMGCLRDALVAALTLDTFNRHPDKVVMANVAQLVNNLHSLFLADEDRFVATPSFHVFEMYKPHQGARAVRLDFAGEDIGFEAQGRKGSIFRLAGSASVKEKDLTVTLVHTHAAEPCELALDLGTGRAAGVRRTVLTHAELNAHNTFEEPARVVPKSDAPALEGSTLRIELAPASVTRLDIRLG